ncbi:hypothetical protein JCM19314_1824 [Nonlabens ulvanivorans]|uniref:ScoMcrA-like N-terminal head domain-containing protein n=1 Tax=Nonlabens ulvanivorans TaxID=906888 RepID=A0A090QZB7_NONUL|nr:hypothetical protein [Nonlabens ulvanivorans]GAL00787.1 hypothetical protein JCM19314_1824 [Nonlabens ulvanivorans]
MEFDKVTAQHIKQGIKDYEEKGFPKGFGPSSTYDVLYEGKLYPPKAIMAYANYHATGRALENYFKGGPNEDCFKALKRNGFEIVAKQKKDLYNWTQTHLELASYLKDKRSNTSELIELLKESGVNVMQDQSQPGISIPLEEMDPFTFICHIYKYGEKKRLDIIQKIAKKLGLFIPDGERGIPSANAQKVWMFPYQHERVGNEFNILWELFEATINDTITDDLFQRALNIRNVGKTKITEVLFYVRPFDYFPINGPSKPYLKEELGIEHNFETFKEYEEINRLIKSKSDTSFPELSYKSWHYTNDKSLKQENSSDEKMFLKVINRYSKDVVIGYFTIIDRFVNALKISGEEEAVTFNCSDNKAKFIIGQRTIWDLDNIGKSLNYSIISNEEWGGKSVFRYKGKGKGGALMVTTSTIEPVLLHLDQSISIAKGILLESTTTGYKGNNNSTFKRAVFDKEYRIQLIGEDMIAKEPSSNYQTTSMPLNQIFYGPPGTGKTYYLKEQLFDKYTLKEEAVTEEKYFEEIVSDLTWWQVIALALNEIGTSKVNDILENRWVATKAALSESKNVRATIWGTLQMHTVQESENVAYKQRQNPLIFDKTNDKTWQLLSER